MTWKKEHVMNREKIHATGKWKPKLWKEKKLIKKGQDWMKIKKTANFKQTVN